MADTKWQTVVAIAVSVPRYVAVAPAAAMMLGVLLTVLIVAPQTVDMVASVGDAYGAILELSLASFLLGGSAWYWTRAALNLELQPSPSAELNPGIDEEAMRWSTRTLLVLASLSVSAPVLLDWWSDAPTLNWGWIWIATLVLVSPTTAGLLLRLVIWRRKRIGSMPAVAGDASIAMVPGPGDWRKPFASLLQLPAALLELLRRAPFGTIGSIVLLAPTVFAIYLPGLTVRLPALVAGLLTFALLVPVLTVAVLIVGRLPLLGVATLLLTFGSGFFSNLLCRTVGWTQGDVPGWLPMGIATGAILVAWLIGMGAAKVLPARSMRVPSPPIGLGVQPRTRLFAAAAVLVAIFSLTPPRGMYDIRTLPQSAASVAARPGLGRALNAWREACFPGTTGPVPVVIVAAEGGASKSAAWTLSAMRFLDGETGGAFGRSVFAISGVSGGSLGATTYRELVRRAQARCDEPERWREVWGVPAGDQIPGAGVDPIANQDFLAGTFAAHFLPDVFRRLMGPAFVFGGGATSRADVLAQDFEQYFGDRTGLANPSLLRDGVQRGVQKDDATSNSSLPHLLLNGTDVELGRRLITSTIAFDGLGASTRGIFADADDLLQVVCADMSLGMAVMNSARFPLISPVGGFESPGRDCPSRPGHTERHFVTDGGYHENYGAGTARELAEAIGAVGGPDYEPIILVISNDADLADDDPKAPSLQTYARTCDQPQGVLKTEAVQQGRGQQVVGTSSQVLAPLHGLLATRAGHGEMALIALQRTLCTPDSQKHRHLFHMAMRKPKPSPSDPENRESAPINWVLNQSARRLIELSLTSKFNCGQATELALVLNPNSPLTACGRQAPLESPTRTSSLQK